MGFPERNDSFDFIAALEEYKKQVKIAKGIFDNVVNKKLSNEKVDYSLKQGETFSLNIGSIIVPKNG